MGLLEIGMKKNSPQSVNGFTLLEILVVLIIIGITLTFAILFFGDFGQKRRIVMFTETFVQKIKLAQQQAILEGQTYAVRLDQKGFQILKWLRHDSWQPLSQKGIFNYQNFPQSVKINFSIQKNFSEQNMVILHSSGDMTPFEMTFSNKNDQYILKVIGKHDGTIINEESK